MAAIPGAEYWGPLPDTNFAKSAGRRSIIGATIHHIDGSLAAADSTFKSVGRKSSACYGVGRDGRIVYWLDPEWMVDYHACQAQWQGYIGIENESDPNNDNEPLSAAQIDACARIAKFHRIPGVFISRQGEPGVGYHRQFSAGGCDHGWGNTSCPGIGVIAQIPDIVDAINGGPPPTPTRKVNSKMWMAAILDKKWCDVYYNGVLVDAFPNDGPLGIGEAMKRYIDAGAAYTIFKTEADYAPARKRLAAAAT